MADFYTQILTISTFVLIFTLISKLIKDSLYLPESLVSLIFGILVGKHVLQIIQINPYSLFFISRMILSVQTMNVSLSLPRKYVSQHYPSLLVLVLVLGCIKCLFTFLILCIFKSLSFTECWHLASSLTPTDPILCSSIIKGKLKIPNRIRTLLLAESGINDGLGIILLSIPENPNVESFLYDIIFFKIVLSSACGLLLGFFAKSFYKFCYRRSLIGMDAFVIHTFLLVLVSIGLMEIIGGSEFICIFFCGIQFSSDEFISIEYDRNMQDTVDLLISASFFVIFGSTLDFTFNLKEILTGLLIICVRRPLICYFLCDIIKDLRNKKEGLFVGWFGPIGVGAIYYSMMVDYKYGSNLYVYASKIVFLSVCVHGMTVLVYKIICRMNHDQEMLVF
ncbi:hypothetical protein P3W45_001312 [Vairimorpha bombi]|jgi:sodium/hydrogen antiporter